MPIIMKKVLIPLILIAVLIPVKAQTNYTISYNSKTHTLILENSTSFKIEIINVYELPENETHEVKSIVYDPVTGNYSNTTLGNVTVKYYSPGIVRIRNLWSNDSVSVTVSLAYREEILNKGFTIAEGEEIVLPTDVDDIPGIYNITITVEDAEVTLPLLVNNTVWINTSFDSGKSYDNTVAMGDNGYMIVNAIGARKIKWEILGLNPTPNGLTTKDYNDEFKVTINTTWLHDNYGMIPKTYSFHVVCDDSEAYGRIIVSDPSVSVVLDNTSIASGKNLKVRIYTNVASTDTSYDGTPNRLYIAIVRGTYNGDVNVSNHTLNLPDNETDPVFMWLINDRFDLGLNDEGSMDIKYIIDAPGFENLTYWTVVAVVVTDDNRGTVNHFYGESYAFFRIVVPKISIKAYVYEHGETYESNRFYRSQKIQFKGYADLPARYNLSTPNYLYIFVEDGDVLGVSSNVYTFNEMKGTLEKVYILDEYGYFESSIWNVRSNASFKSYRVFAIITSDGKPPRVDNVLNMTWINVTVVRPNIEVYVEEKVPPGSTLTINGWADSKYVYIYASDEIFTNIPANPKEALKLRTIEGGEGRTFVFVGYVKEDADIGKYSLFFYASDSDSFDPTSCLAERVVHFEVVPLDVKADNLTVIRGENDLITFHLNGELRCKVKYKFKVSGYTYTNSTYPFGMVYEGEKFVKGRDFTILIPTHYNENGLTTEMGFKAIPSGKYPLKLWIYSNSTGRLLIERTFYIDVVDPIYNISTQNNVLNGKIVVNRGTELVINIESNRRCHYDWIFFAIEGEMGVEKCGWVSVDNGKVQIEINTEEFKGRFFKFYLIDTMGSGSREDVESKFNMLPKNYDLVEMNGILCKVYRKNPYARSYLGDDDLTIVFEFEVVDTQTGHYTYIFPAIDENGSIFVHALYGKADVFLDLNFNGVRDYDETSKVVGNSWVEFKVPSGIDCVKLVSNRPILTFYRYEVNESYKDLSYEYSPSFAGREFVVPFDGYAYISPLRSSLVEITYNGSVLGKKFIEVGEVWKVEVRGGYIIKSGEDVVVVLKCSNEDCRDYTWAVSLIPNAYAGRKIMIPPRIDVYGMYSDYKYVKQLAYIAYIDGTLEVVELSDKPKMLELKKPAVAYVFYDAYVRDESSPVYILRHHALAFKVYPVNELGYGGVALSILSPCETKISIDSNYDGIFDKSVVTNGTYNEPTKTINGVHTVERGMFKSDNPVMVYSVDLDKNGLSYAFTLTTEGGIEGRNEFKRYYEYLFPLIMRGHESSIYVYSVYGETNVFLDLNFNGVKDEGEPSAIVNGSYRFDVYWDCVRLISDKPIVTFYKFANGIYQFSYSPEKGKEFIVPFDGYAYILSSERTNVTVGNNSYTVDMGKVLKVAVKSGETIKSATDISVVLSSCDFECGNWSWAVSLIPTSKFGNEIVIPSIHYEFSEAQYTKTEAYLTYIDGNVTSFIVDGLKTIKTDKPAVAYILFDAYVRCSDVEVCGKYRFVHYSSAFKVYPISELGTKGVAFTILSPFNGNEIKIDQNYDGIFESGRTLNRGENLTIYGTFKSKYPVLVYYITPTSAFSYEPFEKGEIPIEKTPTTTTVPTISTTTTTVAPTPNATITLTPKGEQFNLIGSLNSLLKAIENTMRLTFETILKGFVGSFSQTINKIYKIMQTS